MHITPLAVAAGLAAALSSALLPAQAQSLSTTFVSNNGGSSGWVVMFDATVSAANPLGLRVTAVDVNCSNTAAGGPVTVNVYTTPTTYLGVERNPAAWTLVSTGNGTQALRNSPTFVDIEDFVLPMGAWGIAVQTIGPGQAYTDGNSTNQSYSDANLSLSLGASLASQFLSTGLLFTPRVWNGTIYYAAVGDAVYGTFGSGCSGTNGVPTLAPAPQSHPSVGQTLTLNVGHGPTTATVAFLAFGFSKTVGAGQPLPWDLSFLGMTGCSLRVDPVAQVGVAVINGSGSFGLPIPNNTALYWIQLYSQAFVADPGANPVGFIATNGCEGVIGR
jgi:hypothetical protein